MLQCGRDLVLELLAVDGGAASPGARRITALNHEVGYYAVEDLVVEVVALRKGGEVLARLRRMVVVEFNNDDSLLVVRPGTSIMGITLTVVVSIATSVAMVGMSYGDCDA